GEEIGLRKQARLHTGVTQHDGTEVVDASPLEADYHAAYAIGIQGIGIEIMVKAADRPVYDAIDGHIRPGINNTEPHPTAERFVDLLFPRSGARAAGQLPEGDAA